MRNIAPPAPAAPCFSSFVLLIARIRLIIRLLTTMLRYFDAVVQEGVSVVNIAHPACSYMLATPSISFLHYCSCGSEMIKKRSTVRRARLRLWVTATGAPLVMRRSRFYCLVLSKKQSSCLLQVMIEKGSVERLKRKSGKKKKKKEQKPASQM